MNKTNNQVSVNTLQAQNFFNSQNTDLLNELNKAQLHYTINRLEHETDSLFILIDIEQPHSTTATNYLEHFTIKAVLYNNPNETDSKYNIALEHNRGSKDYPHTAEQREAWKQQNTFKHYNFIIDKYALKMGNAVIINENPITKENLYIHQAIKIIVELAKQLATAKE